MISRLQTWLANAKRDYNEGVELFNTFANEQQKKDFGKFFNEGLSKPNISQFDIRFTTLINQLSFAMRAVQRNPQMFKSISALQKPAKKQTAKPAQKLDIDKLPDSLDAERQRLKEIVPIMARIHAEISVSDLAQDKRAKLRAELILLDDERRAIWSKLDHFADTGKMVRPEKSAEEKELEQNMLLQGANMAKRVGQLRSYITRNTSSVKKFTESGDTKKAEVAQLRLDGFKKELDQLLKLIDG